MTDNKKAKIIRFPTAKAPKSQAKKDRIRFGELDDTGTMFGPCTMPPWAGTSGFSQETIDELDEMFSEEGEQ